MNVSIRQLAVHMGGTPVLENLDLDVVAGEFLVLLGPSGCGKSTLLHAIAGLVDVAAGAVHIGGRDVTWADPKDRAIGMVFQSYALYPTMNVERNMSFGLRVAGTPKAEVAQRVAIGRALVREAQVFLFDEPLSNLDAKLRTELRRELKALHRELGATMVYVTHDQVEAMTLATRVAVMRGGRIQQVGTPGEVYARPANMFVAGFLGSPSMNFIEGETSAGGAAVLGVRPEHLALHPADGARSEGEIALVEAMGAHEVVWLDMHGHRLAAIAPATGAHRIGDRVGVQIALDRASVFDPVSQERIELHAGAFHHHPR